MKKPHLVGEKGPELLVPVGKIRIAPKPDVKKGDK